MRRDKTQTSLTIPFPTLMQKYLTDYSFPCFQIILEKHLELQQQQHLQVLLCRTVAKVQNTMRNLEKTVFT